MTKQTDAVAEVAEHPTLSRREREDMTVVECLLDAGFEIRHEYAGGWDSFCSSFVFGVSPHGNQDKLKRLVEKHFPDASTTVERDRRMEHYAVISVEPTKSEWEEIVAFNAPGVAEHIGECTVNPIWDGSVAGRAAAIRRLQAMTETEIVALIQRLTVDGKLRWELKTEEIFPRWDVDFCELKPDDIR